MPTWTATLLASLVLAFAACTTPNTSDCQDACSHQTERTFCDIDGVYPGTNLENECIAPPSADACNRVESCPDGQLCTDDSMGVCVECLVASDCGVGQSCSDSNTCVLDSCMPGTAGDEACLASNADLPRCGPDQSCVACLASADCSGAGANASVCDEEAFECRGCIANNECESKVCGLDAGVCAAENDIVHVAKNGADGASCGTITSPCLTIAGGLAQVTAERDVLLIGAGEYAEKVILTDIAVSLVGDGVVNLNPALGPSDAAVLVSGSSNARIDGIDIDLSVGGSSALLCDDSASGTASLTFSRGTISRSDTRGSGVKVKSCAMTIFEATISGNGFGISVFGGGVLNVTRSVISGNPLGGIGATDASLSITRSTISDNGTNNFSGGGAFFIGSGGGVSVANSQFEIVNNFIVNNGSTVSEVGGLRIINTAEIGSQLMRFNTIANSRTGKTDINDAKASSTTCEVTTPLVASGNIIVGGQGQDSEGTSLPNLFASGCSFEYSDIEDGPAGTGNIDATPLFVNPVAGSEADFHLQSGSPCIDAADPAATVDIDVDGDIRPQGAGPDMGADEAQ